MTTEIPRCCTFIFLPHIPSPACSFYHCQIEGKMSTHKHYEILEERLYKGTMCETWEGKKRKPFLTRDVSYIEDI